MQNVESQIARTLKKTGQFKAVTPNLAAEGASVKDSEYQTGIVFAINRVNGSLSDTVTGNATTLGGKNSILLPNDALFGDNGKN